MKSTPVLAFPVLALCFLASCDNDDDTDNAVVYDRELANDEAYVNSEMNEVSRMSEETMYNEANSGGRLASDNICAQAVVDKENKLITLDFGTEGCSQSEGSRVRKGKIMIAYSGLLILGGGARTITFENYSVDGNVFNGSISTGDLQINGQSFEYSRSTDISVQFAEDGSTFTHKATHSLQLKFGAGLENMEIIVQGGSSGLTRAGEEYLSNITAPLTYTASCMAKGYFYPVSGTHKIEVGEMTFQLDYGTGDCDKNVMVAVGGVSAPYILP